jgi:hypothetical protein
LLGILNKLYVAAVSTCAAISSVASAAATLVTWSSPRRVTALIVATDCGVSGPSKREAYRLNASSPIGSARPIKSNCWMRRFVARWETGITDLEAARERVFYRGRTSGGSVAEGAAGNTCSRKKAGGGVPLRRCCLTSLGCQGWRSLFSCDPVKMLSSEDVVGEWLEWVRPLTSLNFPDCVAEGQNAGGLQP